MSVRDWFCRPEIVRPRSNGKMPVLLCLLLSGITALVVFRWGREQWLNVRPEPTFTATAHVVAPSDVEGGARVPFAATDSDPHRARRTADAKAESYIEERRAEWRDSMKRPLSDARRSAEEARRQREEAVARLDAFQRQHREQEAAVREGAAPAAESRPKLTTNPAWLELERRSMELIERREKLLADRTELHPAVQEVSDEIVELERRMAEIPREIPDTEAGEAIAPPLGPAFSAPEQTAPEQTALDDKRILAELAAAVEEKTQLAAGAELAEQQAEQRLLSFPQYTVERAEAVENPAPFDFAPQRLLWTVLATGFLMAFGVGSLAFGAGVDPPVACAADVRAKTGKAVVGTIPAENQINLSKIGRQRRIRRTTIALGIILLFCCPAVAIWGVLGI